MHRQISIFLKVLILFIFIAFYPPCALSQNNTDSYVLVPIGSGKIGVMPFLLGRYYADIDVAVSKTLTCSIDQLCFDPEDVKLGAERIIKRQVEVGLQSQFENLTIPPEMVTEAYNSITADRTKDSLRTLAQKVGKAIHADHIMVGVVWRYKDRVGTAAGVKRPASVAFALYLVEVNTGTQMWRGYFEKTQKALFDNILDTPLYLKSGIKWLTASELSRYGVRTVLDSIPESKSN